MEMWTLVIVWALGTTQAPTTLVVPNIPNRAICEIVMSDLKKEIGSSPRYARCVPAAS
jgi:hypothetical protein